jgi:hypothetical protein
VAPPCRTTISTRRFSLRTCSTSVRSSPAYSEADDVARADLLAAASPDKLKELADAPTAHWDAINAFLDEHVAAELGPEQDVALALDAFAQAALEARSELESR